MLGKKKKKEGPKLIKTMSLKDFENLTKSIQDFIDDCDGISCDEDSVEIEIYDNGRIKVFGEFKSRDIKWFD